MSKLFKKYQTNGLSDADLEAFKNVCKYLEKHSAEEALDSAEFIMIRLNLLQGGCTYALGRSPGQVLKHVGGTLAWVEATPGEYTTVMRLPVLDVFKLFNTVRMGKEDKKVFKDFCRSITNTEDMETLLSSDYLQKEGSWCPYRYADSPLEQKAAIDIITIPPVKREVHQSWAANDLMRRIRNATDTIIQEFGDETGYFPKVHLKTTVSFNAPQKKGDV